MSAGAVMPRAVLERDGDVVVVGARELRRWPFTGLVGSIAWRFDGERLRLVHLQGGPR